MTRLTFLLALVFSLPVVGCEVPDANTRTSKTAESVELDDMKWEKRVILLFAPGPRDPLYVQQQEALALARDGVTERDLVIIVAFADGSGLEDGLPIDQKSVRALRRDFQPAPGRFTFVLVGKDGTEKSRSVAKITEVETIFATIDAMPMRKRELQEDGAAGK